MCGIDRLNLPLNPAVNIGVFHAEWIACHQASGDAPSSHVSPLIQMCFSAAAALPRLTVYRGSRIVEFRNGS